MATCEHCGNETPLAKRTGKSRKFCSKECSHASWIAANPERRKQHVKTYDTSEHGKARREVWDAENAEDQKSKKHTYYQNNKQRFIEASTQYVAQNRESVHAYKLEWQKTEKGRKNSLQSRRRRIARKLNAPGSHTIDEFYELCAEFEDRCLCCLKQFERRKLSIDHVVPISKGGSDGIENLQPLCRRCNATKSTLTIDYRPTFWWRGPSLGLENYLAVKRLDAAIAAGEVRINT